MSIQALRERRAARAADARKLLNDYPAEKWGADQQAEFDRLEGEITSLDQQISNHQKMLDREAETTIADAQREGAARNAKEKKATDPLVIFDTWMRHGPKRVSDEQWAAIRNTMSTTTNSEGGFTVPSLISAQLIDSMKAFGAMRAVSEIIRTEDGKPLSFPTSDGTSEVGEIVAQNASATGADPSFGTVSLNVFKYSSKVVAVPIELLQDTVVNLEGLILNRLGKRLGRIGNQHFTTGTGTTQPDGVIPRATVGKTGTTGQTTTIIYDDLVDLVHSLDPAYRIASSAFMASDAMLRVLRKLKDTAGRPIWMPSYDAGISRAANPAGHGGYSAEATPVVFDYLLGYPVYVNNDLATPAANAKSLAFGDFSFYKIRDAMSVEVFRFTDSAYAQKGQVGFLAWARMGGNLVDTAAVKVYQHSAT